MRKPIIVGNWKMHKTCAETIEFINEVDPLVADSCTYGIATPFTALKDATSNAKNLIIAAENCHYADHGAYTGEISIPMLKELNVTHCIVGHSERRQMFNETDESVNLKVKALIANGITPIVCVGESLEAFENKQTAEVIKSQIQNGLKELEACAVANIVVAYEPIWAIGTGKSATKEIAQDTIALIRQEIAKMYPEASDKVRIQYGGSVKPNNIREYLAMPDIDGALIGGASLDAESFKAIIEASK